MVDASQQESQTTNAHRVGWKQKLPLGFILVVIILIVGGLLAYFHWHNTAPTLQQISTAQHEGNYQKAISLTKKAISKTKDTNKQTFLYTALGNNYLNSNQPDLAIQAYKSAAQATAMTGDVAYLIASTYQSEHNNAQAIAYYKQAIRLWPTSDPLYKAQVASMQDDINTLQGMAGKQ